IHPGYGFLSENPDFAEACAAAGVVFIGPGPAQMRAFGLKHTARELALANQVPLLPGSGLLSDAGHAQAEAARIGYPVMLKSTAGGGGIGMRLCWSADELAEAFQSVERLARANFKETGIYLEKYVEHARHIEVQLFGDGQGRVVALGERDCSVQRRNQKVIEETPAPGLTDAQRTSLLATAVRLGEAVGYTSAGTVEFVYDTQSGEFYFLEVNTRLQVEHGVTEEVTGVDLVEWMIRAAAGESPLAGPVPEPRGASIQVRLYAEDPAKNFQPSAGLLTAANFPPGIRVDTWVERGSEVPAFYDPLVAKVIVRGKDRREAIARMQAALDASHVAGIETNLDYLRQIVRDAVFTEGHQTTRYLNGFHYRPNTIDVLEPGVQSSIQDWPGRLGYWDIGVPPSGPMDALSLRLGNRLVGNGEGSAALELTMAGPTLRFNSEAIVALAGAAMPATLDGVAIEPWTAHRVPSGAVLRLGAIKEAGARAYLCVQGGFDVPDYLGSRSTFTLGQFGGHAGRTLRVGDVLHISPPVDGAVAGRALATEWRPMFGKNWDIGVLYGPHGAPDFFTDGDIATFFATDWEVHYNSSRTGVRLIGPKPEWARTDGGEAGLHPSNIHDNAYAIGAIDFTGDMPVILGPDGPSLGGFVCPAVVVQAELWKLGQLRPGDTVRFHRLTQAEAAARAQSLDAAIAGLDGPLMPAVADNPTGDALQAVVHRQPAGAGGVDVVYRRAGDAYLLVEYGELKLDLALRMRAHALME
ncbi:MAG TPA: 5-oxoprolinase/urea amidolyase family protein, partial [Chromatiales bacterium]|nr:5-oxoprolinase/urea amidolyase family protein [Chromatiales bacterium]